MSSAAGVTILPDFLTSLISSFLTSNVGICLICVFGSVAEVAVASNVGSYSAAVVVLIYANIFLDDRGGFWDSYWTLFHAYSIVKRERSLKTP